MRNILVLIFLFSTFVSFAQPGVATVVQENGKSYYQHTVVAGNTLWGIHQMYGVSVQDIMDKNPGVADGLDVGQVLLIPKIGGEEEVVTSSYKVKNKETLYGLSKKFNTTVDELIRLNPELKDGLKKGQIIKVPGDGGDVVEPENHDEPEVITTENPFTEDKDTVQHVVNDQQVQVTFSDSTINHVVLAHETMYKISKRFMVSIEEIMKINGLSSTQVKEGQILVIPVKKERIEKVRIKPIDADYNPNGDEPLEFDVKDEYTIAVLLPLHLTYGPGYSEYISQLSTQFYMGAIMALDSLERKGLNAKVHFFDTQNDTNAVKKLLTKPVFNDVDLVIGPLLGKNLDIVANYCKANKVRMVCPVAVDAKLLENNRLVYSSVPSNITLMRGLAKHLIENCSKDNIVLVKPLDKGSLPLYEAFRKAFNEAEGNGTKPNLIETTVEGFNTYIKRSSINHFVVPTNDRSTAMKFMNNVNRSAFRAKPDQINVYGTKEWERFTDINNGFKNKYNFHFAGTNFVDYYTDEMKAANTLFREKYKTDMSKVAVQAYDVVTYYLSAFFMGNDSPNLLMNNFDMYQISENDGYENSNVFIIKQVDYELIHLGTASGR